MQNQIQLANAGAREIRNCLLGSCREQIPQLCFALVSGEQQSEGGEHVWERWEWKLGGGNAEVSALIANGTRREDAAQLLEEMARFLRHRCAEDVLASGEGYYPDKHHQPVHDLVPMPF